MKRKELLVRIGLSLLMGVVIAWITFQIKIGYYMSDIGPYFSKGFPLAKIYLFLLFLDAHG